MYIYERLHSHMQSIVVYLGILVFLPSAVYAQLNWTFIYDDVVDQAGYMIYSPSDDIYVGGITTDGSEADMVVLCMNTSGDTNWVYKYDSTSGSSDMLHALCYGGDNNIYIGGGAGSPASERKFTVISLSDSGSENWVYRYEGTSGYRNCAYAICYGNDGNIYAAGVLDDSGTDDDFVVISLQPTGDTNWVHICEGSEPLNENANAIIFGSDSNLYAAGRIEYKATVVSLTMSGDTNWIYSHNSVSQLHEIVQAPNGVLYAAGYCNDNGQSADLLVVSLTTSGDTNWTYVYDGNGPVPYNDDRAHDIICGPEGVIYAIGRSTQPNGYEDAIIIALDSLGSEKWISEYNGPANDFDDADEAIYGNDGYIYVVGTCTGPGLNELDFLIMRIDTLGATDWVYLYDGPSSNDDIGRAIAFGADDNTYATGYSNNGMDYDIIVISLGPLGYIDESGDRKTMINEGSLHMHPTLFSDATHIIIKYSNPDEPIALTVYDITGKPVKKLLPFTAISNNLNIAWDGTDDHGKALPAGVYFCRLSTGDRNITKKIIKLR
jgi:hypothetical protein